VARWPEQTPEQRFWPKVRRGAKHECWEWLATRIPDGYGYFRVGSPSRSVLAHRFAYESLVGSIDDGLVIDHLCRNRGCVNPAHMEVVTSAENTRRGRFWNRDKTHCIHGHEFTPENTYTYANGKRRCKTCARRWVKETRVRVKNGTTFKGQGRPPTRSS
jgi:hypothetical protein